MAGSDKTLEAIVALSPYVLQLSALLVNFLETLSDEDIGDNPEALQKAIRKYRDSAVRADAAISRLEEAIARKDDAQHKLGIT